MGIAIKGRGSTSHLAGRFESTVSEAVDDGWAVDESEEFLARACAPKYAPRPHAASSAATPRRTSASANR
jgi:hypothetical protein